jgi:hypothetical protein
MYFEAIGLASWIRRGAYFEEAKKAMQEIIMRAKLT